MFCNLERCNCSISVWMKSYISNNTFEWVWSQRPFAQKKKQVSFLLSLKTKQFNKNLLIYLFTVSVSEIGRGFLFKSYTRTEKGQSKSKLNIYSTLWLEAAAA